MQVPTANATILASAAAAALISGNVPALADVPTPPPQIEQATKQAQNQSMTFPSSEAPKPASTSSLPEGNQWRYSEFIGAVESGKVERVRFSKDGSQLQLTAVDGRRAQVRASPAHAPCHCSPAEPTVHPHACMFLPEGRTNKGWLAVVTTSTAPPASMTAAPALPTLVS